MKQDRVKLSSETREKLVRAYVKRYIATNKKLPTRREVGLAVGGAINTILLVLKEYRQNTT